MVGGQPAIIHRRELEAQDFCEVLDLDNLQQGWSPLPFEAYSKVRFFFPGTILSSGRLSSVFVLSSLCSFFYHFPWFASLLIIVLFSFPLIPLKFSFALALVMSSRAARPSFRQRP